MNKKAITAAVVVCLLGALAFWWKGSGGDEKTAKNEDAVEKPTRKAQPRSKQRRNRGGDADNAQPIYAEDDPVGTLRLEGQVVAGDMEPVAGATVTINSVPPRFTKSEEDGSFYFEKLVGRQYRLVAHAEDEVGGPVSVRLNEKSEPVILKVAPAALVEVTAVDAKTGKPVPGASVEVRGIAVRSATTDAKGVAKVKPIGAGRYDVVGKAPGYAPFHYPIRVVGSEKVVTARLELAAGAKVSGTVRDQEGKPVAGARVVYNGASSWAQSGDSRLDAAETDSKGVFEFPALPAGTFRFVARADEYAPGTSELVTLNGASEQNGVDIVIDRGATLTGLVVKKEGEPAGGSQVRVQTRVDGMRWSRPRQVFADDSGKFRIAGLPRKEIEIIAKHDEASSELVVVDFESKDKEDIQIVLGLDGSIAGVVVDQDGEPVDGAQVSAFPDFRAGGRAARVEWRLRGFSNELADAGGRFKITGLKPGAYRVRASPPGASTRGRRFLREGVAAEPGDTDLRIVLEKDGGVKGKVVFQDGTPVGLFQVSVGFRTRTPFTNSDGSFEMGELPPRDYTVQIRGSDFDNKQLTDIEVKAGDYTDLGTITVNKGRKISGRVVDKNGSAVAGATIRAGRRLFGDGSSSTSRGGGPPWARDAKESKTDDNGEFTISGVGATQVSLVAEHEEAGRSPAITIPASIESTTGLTMNLAPFGALQGVVRRGGAPAESIIVNASSKTNPGVSFGVSTGADGTFRFDRLAPDTYNLEAMTGRPMRGMAFHRVTVDVQSEKTARAELSIEEGDSAITVVPQAGEGGIKSLVWLDAVRAKITAANAADLAMKVAAIPEGSRKQGMSFGGNPGQLEGLMAGLYTVCATVYPEGLRGMGDTMAYMAREGDNLPVFCKEITVASGTQNLDLPVEVPEFVPPPGG